MRQEVVAALEEIRAANSGLLRAEDVVAAAADPGSPLHDHFEWDESAAAAAHRLQQARSLIRAVVTIRPSAQGGVIARAYVSLPSDRTQAGGGYRAIEDVVESPAMVLEALDDLERLLTRARARFIQFRSMTPLVDQMIGSVEAARQLARSQQ
jgi:hypothetical protein